MAGVCTLTLPSSVRQIGTYAVRVPFEPDVNADVNAIDPSRNLAPVRGACRPLSRGNRAFGPGDPLVAVIATERKLMDGFALLRQVGLRQPRRGVGLLDDLHAVDIGARRAAPIPVAPGRTRRAGEYPLRSTCGCFSARSRNSPSARVLV